MKFITSSLIALLLSFVATAFADEAPKPEFQAKIISIEEQASPEIPSSAIDQHGGKNTLFIHAIEGWSSTYPKIANAIKMRMQSLGIRVVDKPEDADVGLQFGPVSGFEFDEIESGADSSGSGISMENVMVLVVSVTTHTPISGGGPMFLSNEKRGGIIGVCMFNHPTIGSRGKMRGDSKSIYGAAGCSSYTVLYSANEYGAKSSIFALSSVVDRFITDHIVADPAAPRSSTEN